MDAGPLVAIFNRRDEHHGWSVRRANQFDEPFLTCEPVLTEAHFLLGRTATGRRRLSEFIAAGKIEVPFSYIDHIERVHELMRTYENIPISFADACIIRMSEIYRNAPVFTTDGDYHIYRRNGNQAIDVLMP